MNNKSLGEIVADVPDPSVISQDYSSIQGIQNMLYEQRMPLPSSCLDRIDAAFYFYDRDTTRQQDLFYLMSFGYVWACVFVLFLEWVLKLRKLEKLSFKISQFNGLFTKLQ